MTVLEEPAKESYIFIEFAFGTTERHLIRLTDASKNMPSPGSVDPPGVFFSEPTLDVKIPKRTGFLKEEPLTVKLNGPFAGFFHNISNGEPHEPVIVKVWEQHLDQIGNQELLFPFAGRLTIVRRNPEGVSGAVELQAATEKDLMENALVGIPGNHQCIWFFGKEGCEHSVEFDDYTITQIIGSTVRTNLTPTRAERFYHRGYVELNDLRILIRDWRTGDAFELDRTPPQKWLNKVCRFFEGCDKLLATCKFSKFNEERFMGFGYATPYFNPVFEEGEI